jgi:GNAT superfamily N-acetyltransferase
MVSFGVATSDDDLQQILNLQSKNLSNNISEEESKSEGFVTMQHDLFLLKRMNEPHPHVVARNNEGLIIAYALTMLRSFVEDIPLCAHLCEILDTHYSDDDNKYSLIGQVCIAKEYRGQGVLRGLYKEMQRQMKQANFKVLATAVDLVNTRSLHAHVKIGFTVLEECHFGGQDWAYVLLPTDDSSAGVASRVD